MDWRRLLSLALLSATPVLAQPAPVIDNARVIVRDVTLASGEKVRTEHARDYVTIFLIGGEMRVNGAPVSHQAGDAVYAQAGSETDEAIGGNPRLVVVDLNEAKPAPPLANKTRYPLAFPRPGVKKVLENDKVIVWNYAWEPGKPTPMHYHDKDVVVVYRGEGTLDSVTPDGEHTPTAHHVGEIRFNKGDRAHYELLTQGAQSAIMVELK
jgi:quercetin dioxygenase-like cupin family protein